MLEDLDAIVEFGNKTQIPLDHLFVEVLGDIMLDISNDDDETTERQELVNQVIKESLRVAAERFCRDPAARGRTGMREKDLKKAVNRLAEWGRRGPSARSAGR